MLTYEINRPDEAARAAARARWDAVAKPLHSLGLLEDLIVRIAGIQRTDNVSLAPRCALKSQNMAYQGILRLHRCICR